MFRHKVKVYTARTTTRHGIIFIYCVACEINFGAIVSALRAFFSCSLAYLLTYCTLPLSK